MSLKHSWLLGLLMHSYPFEPSSILAFERFLPIFIRPFKYPKPISRTKHFIVSLSNSLTNTSILLRVHSKQPSERYTSPSMVRGPTSVANKPTDPNRGLRFVGLACGSLLVCRF